MNHRFPQARNPSEQSSGAAESKEETLIRFNELCQKYKKEGFPLDQASTLHNYMNGLLMFTGKTYVSTYGAAREPRPNKSPGLAADG